MLLFEIENRCKEVISKFNDYCSGMSDIEKVMFTKQFNDADFLFRVAIPFEDRGVRYNQKGISMADHTIQLKHWRSWENENKEVPLAKNWKESFETSYQWLIEKENDLKKVLIGVWCTKNQWRYILQVGSTTGDDPKVNAQKMKLLPFLNSDNHRISGLKTLHSRRFNAVLQVEGMEVKYILIGEATDTINFVMYYQKFGD